MAKYENKIYETTFDMTNESEAKDFWFAIQCLNKIAVENGWDWGKFLDEHVVFCA